MLFARIHCSLFVALATICTSMQLGLAQIELKVGVIEAEGFCEWDASEGKWTGFIPDIVAQIGDNCLPRFKPKFQKVADGRYGQYQVSTQTWTGLIGEVVNGTVQMAAAPLTQTSAREAHIDFTHELLDVGLVTLARPVVVASPLVRSAGFFLAVFDAGVWLSFFVVFLATSLMLFLNARYNPREVPADPQQNQQQQQQQQRSFSLGGAVQDSSEFSLLNSLLFTISTGCFQGYSTMPKSLAGRCVSAFWWIFVAIFAATYVAGFLCGLVATRGSLSNRLTTMDARGEFSRNRAGFDSLVPVWLAGGSTDATIRSSKDPLFKKFAKLNSDFRLSSSSNRAKLEAVKSIADVVQLVKSDPRFVGILESDTALLMASRSNCELKVGRALLTDKSYAFALKEHSNLTRVVNHAMLKLRETGVVRELYQRHFGSEHCTWPDAPSSFQLAGDELARVFRDSLPIGLGTFAGPIVLYCCGLLLSMAAGLLDVYVFTRYERYQRSSHQVQHIDDAGDPTFGALSFDDQQPVIDRLET